MKNASASPVSPWAWGLGLGTLAIALGAAAVQAQVWSTHPAAEGDLKAARARLEADLKLCTQGNDAEARMQCRHDAQAVFDRSTQQLRPSAGTYSSSAAKPASYCPDCGRVTAIEQAEQAGASNAVGLIAGGVAGAILGHQVGGGFGKDLATVAGAAGGAYAGQKIQAQMGAHKTWTVVVRRDDGREDRVHFNTDPGLAVGDRVRRQANTLVRE